MKTQVVTVSSRIPDKVKTPYYHFDKFLESLLRFEVTPTVLGMDELWSGLMTKPNLLRAWLRAGNNTSDRLIVSDAWDIIFDAHPDGIGEWCAQLFGDAIVFNAEKACWPRSDLSEHFPETGTPWRYLNSGFMCGPASRILALLESMNLEEIGVDCRRPDGTKSEPNDQGEYQKAFVAQPVPMVVDGKCQLAQTFSGCTLDEFDLSSAWIRNKMTGTHPGVFHFNGGSKNLILPAVLEKMGL